MAPTLDLVAEAAAGGGEAAAWPDEQLQGREEVDAAGLSTGEVAPAAAAATAAGAAAHQRLHAADADVSENLLVRFVLGGEGGDGGGGQTGLQAARSACTLTEYGASEAACLRNVQHKGVRGACAHKHNITHAGRPAGSTQSRLPSGGL